MLQLILMSLGAYVFQASASPAFPIFPVKPPGGNPSLPIEVPTPVVLTSVPGASIPNVPATAFPSLPGVSAPNVGGLPSAGLPTPSLPGGPIPTTGLPIDGFPPLPTLTNSVLLASISAVLSGVSIPTGFPTPDIPLPNTSVLGDLPPLPTPGLPVPTPPTVPGVPGTPSNPGGAVKQTSIVTYLSAAIEILLLLVRLITETIQNGGVRVPGVSELGVDVGTNLLGVLLKVAAEYLDKAGGVGAIAA